MKKRILALFLLAALLVSCGTSPTEDTPDAPASDVSGTADVPAEEETEAEPVDSLLARQQVDDELGSKNYNGATFTTLSCNENIYDTSYYGEMTGNAIHDAVYARDCEVEERFNIKFDHRMVMWNEHANMFTNSVLSGLDEYQLYLGQAISASSMVPNDYFLNWKDIPVINYEKPWYSKASNDALTINGKNYLLLGSMSISCLGYTYCMFMNLAQANNLNLPNIYETVNSGKWTYDTLYDYASTCYTDSNGDGTMTDGDFYAYATRSGDIPTFMWAFEADIVNINDDGTFEIKFGDERTASVAERISALVKSNVGTSMNDNGEAYTGGILMNGGMQFTRELALIATGFVKDAVSPNYLEMESPYAIIPYPKFDESQQEYHTMADGSFGVHCAPVTVQDTEMLGTIVEACNAGAWKNIEPTYYDTALKFRGARDEESVAMLDLILNSRILDFAYLHDGFQGYGLSGLQTIVNTNAEAASYVASTIKSVETYYQSVINYYFDIED